MSGRLLRLQNICAGLFDAGLGRHGTRQQQPIGSARIPQDFGHLKEFADHLLGLQKDPDRYFVEALFLVYENNRALVDILHNLSHPPAQPLESLSISYFSNPGSYKYHIRGNDETFKSYETNHQKAYQNHMKNKLREHFEKLF